LKRDISDQISAIRRQEKDYTEFTEDAEFTEKERQKIGTVTPDQVGVNAGYTQTLGRTKKREAHRRVSRGAAEETETTIFSFSPRRAQRNAREEWKKEGWKGESGKIR